jgi:2-hydroxychromene-2-carboxylate isomerase
MAGAPIFYFDLASPYSYLASARVDELLGPGVVWRPILVGAVHKHYRRVSWGATPELRAAGIAEIERRISEYRLPSIVWPTPYPANSLTAMRAATWADQRGRGRDFAQVAFQMAFQEGIDLSAWTAVLEAASRAGLRRPVVDQALDDAAVKLSLRQTTDQAIAVGVYGVPTFDAAGPMPAATAMETPARTAGTCFQSATRILGTSMLPRKARNARISPAIAFAI